MESPKSECGAGKTTEEKEQLFLQDHGAAPRADALEALAQEHLAGLPGQ